MNKYLINNTSKTIMNINRDTYYVVVVNDGNNKEFPNQLGIRYHNRTWDEDKFFAALTAAMEETPVIMAVYKNQLLSWEITYSKINFFSGEGTEKKLIYTI